MKLWRLALFSLFFLPLWADDCFYEDYPPCEEEAFFPFTLTGDTLWVSGADLRTPGFDTQIHYAQANGALLYTQPCSPCWGLLFGGGYVWSKIDWAQNPAFTETTFGYANLSTGAYTKALPDWFWSITANIYFDTLQFDLSDYTLYQGVLWGKYEWWEGMTFHVGVILELGLSNQMAWPILGFDFSPFPNWYVNAVFPMDISLSYEISESWSIAGAIEFLRNRHRFSEADPVPKGIFDYHTTCVEFTLSYEPTPWFSVTGFVGSTLDGDLKVTDRNNHYATHYKFKGSLLAGGSVVLQY